MNVGGIFFHIVDLSLEKTKITGMKVINEDLNMTEALVDFLLRFSYYQPNIMPVISKIFNSILFQIQRPPSFCV